MYKLQNNGNIEILNALKNSKLLGKNILGDPFGKIVPSPICLSIAAASRNNCKYSFDLAIVSSVHVLNFLPS